MFFGWKDAVGFLMALLFAAALMGALIMTRL